MRDPRRRRTTLLVAAATLSTLALAACSDSEPTDGAAAPAATVPAAAVSTDPTGATVDPIATPATEPAPAPTAVGAAVDGAPLLQAALDTLAGGYHFSTHVTLDGTEVLVAEGDRVGAGTRLTIWSNDTSVAYVITPDGSWVLPDGGEWQALDDPPATTDPLTALRSASTVSGSSADGVTTTLVATVPAVDLGIAGEGTADVQLLLNGPALSEVSYTTTVNDASAEVRSQLSGVVDATPVVAPI